MKNLKSQKIEKQDFIMRVAFSKSRKLVIFSFVFALISACSQEERTKTLQSSISETSPGSAFVANLKLSSSGNEIPFPNNLLFSGSTDGTLNIPIEGDDTDFSDPQVALNTLDGFSTVAPMSTKFSDAIDSATVIPGDTVRLFEVTLVNGAVAGVVAELTATDFTAVVSGVDSSQSTLVVLPLKALKAKSSYLVALSDGLKSTSGISVKADLMYEILSGDDAIINGDGVVQFAAFMDRSDPTNTETAQKIEGIRQLTNAAETALVAYTVTNDAGDVIADLNKADMVLSWSFTTQSISDVLNNLYNSIQSSNPTISVNSSKSAESPLAKADIHVGSIILPYYLTAPSEANPTAALTNFWVNSENSFLTPLNNTPVSTSDMTVPLLISIPNATSASAGVKPAGGWPVVIFQHGITSNRSSMLGIADTLADIGYAVIAMDLPLHGLLGSEPGVGVLRDATAAFDNNVIERHFNMDLVDNASSAPGPDGNLDDSGKHFINLPSILTSRDNLRQAIVDLFSLTKALATLDYDGGGADVDVSKQFFMGHSLGAIVGATYLAIESNVQSAVLASPGGGIAKLVDGSATFGPVIASGLSTKGVNKGGSDFESFLGAMQMALDSADPINYATETSSKHSMLLLEVVGGNTSPSDLVVPNNVFAKAPSGTVQSPTAGTDPLAAQMQLSRVSTTTNGGGLKVWVKFNAGHHSSVLSPKDALGNDDALSASVTTEMQTQIASFLATNGANVTINDPDSVVEIP